MKNPVAVALGNALRETRNVIGIPFDELMENIEINSSYYRLLESGTHTIHISKTIDVVKSFNSYGATMSYDGLAGLVMGVYFTQPLIKLATKDTVAFDVEKNKLLISLEAYDPKLFILIEKFDRLDLFRNTKIKSKGVVELLDKEKVTDSVLLFLNNYSEFGETNLDIQKSSLIKKLKKLPTIYFEFVQDTIDNLFYLPTILGNFTLWEWEEKNKKYFTDMICLTRNSKSVVSHENLSRYKYNYLWEKNFEEVKMIIVDDDSSATNLEDKFKDILKSNLNSVEEKDKLKSYEKAVNKMSFSVISENYQPNLIDNLLKGKSLSTKTGRLENELYDAIWIFTIRKDNDVVWNVAFLADINYEDGSSKYMLTNVVSLSYEDLEKKSEQLTKIWEQSNKD